MKSRARSRHRCVCASVCPFSILLPFQRQQTNLPPPLKLGLLTKIVTASDYGFLSGNEHDSATVPTELGQLTAMTDVGYFLYSSKLGGTLPSELGKLSALETGFIIGYQSFSSAITTGAPAPPRSLTPSLSRLSPRSYHRTRRLTLTLTHRMSAHIQPGKNLGS